MRIKDLSTAIKVCSKIHNNKYDYSKAKYIKIHDKTTIICPIHGEFEQSFNVHRMGSGCKKCSNENMIASKKHSPEQLKEKFIKDAKKVHGNKYDYSKVSYVGKSAKDKVEILDKNFGSFFQTYGNHVTLKHGHPSPKAFMSNKILSIFGSIKDRRKNFLVEARKIHNNLYTYPYLKKEFSGYASTITIVCPTCGEIKQWAYNHMKGHGCKNCKRSAIEREIENWLSTTFPNIKIEIGRRDIISRELDIYIPKYKVAVEIGGIFYHSKVDSSYHAKKQNECAALGIHLFTLFDVDWFQKKAIIKSMLRNSLGKTKNKISARKCSIEVIDGNEAKEFLIANHLQGYSPSTVNIGLIFEDTLVSILTLGKPRFNKNFQWEIIRFGSIRNTLVQGGFSRLWNFFIKKFQPKNCITYANLRWGTGKVYSQVGFSWLRKSAPAQWYSKVDGKRVWIHRTKVQKHRLEKLLDKFDPKLTAEENLKNNHWVSIYDCGNNVYAWDSKI